MPAVSDKLLRDAGALFSVPVRIERRSIKNINLYLRPPYEELLVTAPRLATEQRIYAFLREKRDWAEQNLLRLQKRAAKNIMEEELTAARKKAYVKRLSALIPELLAKWEPAIGVHAAGGFRLRVMRRCFGVCHTGKKYITFNTWLGLAPEELIEYIVVHELCHLHEPSHNRRFHGLMDRYLPDWKRRKKALNKLYSAPAEEA